MWKPLTGLLVIALAAVSTLLFVDRAGAEVLLESAASLGTDPFTPPLDPDPGSSPDVPGGRIRTGGTPPPSDQLYGGTGDLGRCNRAQLVRFMREHPAEAAAWAAVHGIEPDAIERFVRRLTPAVLRADTRITNHGFAGGRATPFQSVMEAGTAVLIDRDGLPVVRCRCGNPLKPPVATAGSPKYVGTPWKDFDPSGLVSIVKEPAAPGGSPRATATASPRAAATTVRGNLVRNGGFESGRLSRPWGTGIYEPREEVFWGSADATARVVTTAHSGRYALRLDNRSPLAPHVYRTLSQVVSGTRAGTEYCLSWWARTRNAGPVALTIAVNDAWSVKFGLAQGTTGWTLYAATFTAEKDGFDLRLISENTGTVFVDDLALTRRGCTAPNGAVEPGTDPRA